MTELQKLEQQVAELQATIERMKEPEFTYPMWFKATASNLIVKFTSLQNGIVVSEGCNYRLGESTIFTPHNRSGTWTQVPEPIKQWEPQGGGYWVNSADGSVSGGASDGFCKSFGVEYSTKEQAEWASKQMRSFNLLLAYVAEFDVDENGVQWMPDWEDSYQDKYVIWFSNNINKWYKETLRSKQDFTVHMSKQCAKDLVDKLNSGSVML